MDGSSKRMDKIDGRNGQNYTTSFPHYSPQLYPHSIHTQISFKTIINFKLLIKNLSIDMGYINLAKIIIINTKT
jgi:hypothetical protein